MFAGAWGCSSVGRAPALQAGGHRFDPVHLHQCGANGRGSWGKPEFEAVDWIMSGLDMVLGRRFGCLSLWICVNRGFLSGNRGFCRGTERSVPGAKPMAAKENEVSSRSCGYRSYLVIG